jgi:hypothetical protein
VLGEAITDLTTVGLIVEIEGTDEPEGSAVTPSGVKVNVPRDGSTGAGCTIEEVIGAL